MVSQLIQLDGSVGEGGGQVLRTALAMSIATGKPFVIDKIRAKRAKPGLMRQHLTAVQAAAEICDGQIKGAAVGSTNLEFVPGKLKAGDYCWKIGTAGSTSLVLQTVLPPLLLAERPSSVEVHGGTHNEMAPPFDFLDRAFRPILLQMEADVSLTLNRYGFYPAGGGSVKSVITPGRLRPITLMDRGEIRSRKVTALISALDHAIADRQLECAAHALNWPADCFTKHTVHDPSGPGTALVIELMSEHITEVFSSMGKLGVSSEQVAMNAIKELRAYLASNVPVGEHLADQLLLPAVLCAMRGGGVSRFRTSAPTPHTLTNIETIRTFISVPVRVEPSDGTNVIISVG